MVEKNRNEFDSDWNTISIHLTPPPPTPLFTWNFSSLMGNLVDNIVLSNSIVMQVESRWILHVGSGFYSTSYLRKGL